MYDPRAYGGGTGLGYGGEGQMKKLTEATGGHVYVMASNIGMIPHQFVTFGPGQGRAQL